MKRRSGILAALLTAVALALTGCAGWTSGDVQPGLSASEGAEAPDFAFQPNGPQPGATPEQIVQGFVAAGTSPDEGWAIAKQFLAESFRSEWKPEAGVTIDDLADRGIAQAEEVAEGQATVELSMTVVAGVNAVGAYAEGDPGPTGIPFELALQGDGEWRITFAPDGIVLDRDTFPRVFSAYSIMYFDLSWTYLVPDVRWFPARTATATYIAAALIDGVPSPWLADAVVSAVPEDVGLARAAVPVDDAGVAHVELNAAALGLPQATRDRMLTQLQASLATANITSVQMSVGTLDVDASVVPTRSTRIDPRAAVLVDDGFGFLSGDVLETIPGLSEAIDAHDPVAIELSPDLDSAALRVATGEVLRVRSDGEWAVLDARPALIDPTTDGQGYLWSVPAGSPRDLVAYGAEDAPVAVADAWPEAAVVVAMQLSRDGTRMAALVESGGRHEAWVSGVIRDGDDGLPVRLGEPMRVAVLDGAAVDIGWLDGATVAIVSDSESAATVVLTQQVGGEGASDAAPDGVTTVSGSTPFSSVRIRAEDDTMYVRRGTTWQRAASGILVLAGQQGSPAQ